MDITLELELKRNTGCGGGDEYYCLIIEASVTGEYVPAVIVSPWENSTPAEGPDIDIHSCHEEGSDEQFELTGSEEDVVDDAVYSAYLAEVSDG